MTANELIEVVVKLLQQEGKDTKQEALKVIKEYQEEQKRKVIND